MIELIYARRQQLRKEILKNYISDESAAIT